MATKNATTAVVPSTISNDDLMALLQQAGMSTGGESQFHRMSLKGGILVTDEGTPQEESWPPVKNGPAMLVRIVKPPIYYNGIFFSETEKQNAKGVYSAFDARRIGRPDLNGRFAKKYDNPSDQIADQNANLDAYELFLAETGQRGQFKGDIQLQIVPESHEMTGEETIYTLTLPTTSALDWRGSSRDGGISGVVQEKCFIVQLAEFAAAQAAAAGANEDDQKRAVLAAMTALNLGAVVAGLYPMQASNEKDSSQTWTVLAFKPVHVELGTENPALAAGESTDDGDDIPF